MFDTKKFGIYLARLRKNADMTQSELAEKLKVTRQAVSGYEVGDSFPDISILVIIADLFGVTLDELIGAGEPTRGESLILKGVAQGNSNVKAENPDELVNLAPLLKPSVVGKLAEGLATKGIDISALQKLADYLNDESLIRLFETADFENPDEALLEKLERFVPFMGYNTQLQIYEKLLNGTMDWHFVRLLLGFWPYSLIEAAIIDGALPWETIPYYREIVEKRRKSTSAS